MLILLLLLLLLLLQRDGFPTLLLRHVRTGHETAGPFEDARKAADGRLRLTDVVPRDAAPSLAGDAVGATHQMNAVVDASRTPEDAADAARWRREGRLGLANHHRIGGRRDGGR